MSWKQVFVKYLSPYRRYLFHPAAQCGRLSEAVFYKSKSGGIGFEKNMVTFPNLKPDLVKGFINVNGGSPVKIVDLIPEQQDLHHYYGYNSSSFKLFYYR